jgi:hypothetical protein
MGRWVWAWGSSLFLLLMVCSARSAEFDKSQIPNTQSDLITVVGELAVGDEKKFINIALSSANAVVAFQSNGGSLIAGIEIGRAIRLKGFSTLVPDGVQCASACALAWLGGRIRFMGGNARIGFHAVYTDGNGQPSVSSAGNALVGAYLNQLNLSSAAIFYITDTSPDKMQWLTFADAQNYEIDVRPFNTTAADGNDPRAGLPNAAPSSRENSASSSDLIIKVTYAFIEATNLPNHASMASLTESYADQVFYYGRNVSRNEVRRDKAGFFAKWPKRQYAIKGGSLAVDCPTASLCKANALMDWNASGAGLTSVGTATLSLGWTVQDGVWRINSENSRVITRKVGRSAPNVALPEPSAGKPTYQLNSGANKVVSLLNLSSSGCSPGGSVSGKIVHREFGNDGQTLTNFVIEETDGTRATVNVFVDLTNADQVNRSWIMRGLQTLLVEGRSTYINVRACGAAGRVLELDAAR